MRAAGRAASLAIGLLLSPAAAGAQGVPIEIRVEPVEVVASRLDGLVPRGAWVLSAEIKRFGGISGLVIEAGALTAVTDEGRLLSARIVEGAGGLGFADARLVPMVESDGTRPRRENRDAEGLARLGGRLFVAFERDHRISAVAPDGRLGEPFTLPEFERLPSNGGIEGLAAIGETLLAIPETPTGEAFPVHALDAAGRRVGLGQLPAPPPHLLTGADIGPDGALYVVLRDFSIFTGVSIRVRRHALSGSPPLPVAGDGETLAAFAHASGIDNMEAIALWRDAAGRLRLWLVSDDNFNALQRTLLLDFEVTE